GLHGHMAFGGGVVPELAIAVGAPALDAAVHQRTRIELAQRDVLNARRETGNLYRHPRAIGGVVPELAIGVRTPSLDAAAPPHPVRIGARAVLLHAHREAGSLPGHMAVDGRVVPKPSTLAVEAPAPDTAVHQCARVVPARGNRLNAGREAGNLYRHRAVGGG